MTIYTWPNEDCPLGWGLFDNDDDSLIGVVMIDDNHPVFIDDESAGHAAEPILTALLGAARVTSRTFGKNECPLCDSLGFALEWRNHRLGIAYCRCGCCGGEALRGKQDAKELADMLFQQGIRILGG